MDDSKRDWSDEDLVAWILNRQLLDAPNREELASSDDVRVRLEGYEQFLDHVRGELRSEEAGQNEDLTVLNEAILDRTTREDVSWRGDLRLVGGFLRTRLHSSVVLRVVAASLLIHIAALPVLAYFGWAQPESQTRIGFEFPGELPFAAADPEPQFPDSESETDDVLGEQALDRLGEGESAGALLRARLRAQGRFDLDGLDGDVPVESVNWGDALGLILRSEQLLDERDEVADLANWRRRAHLDFVLSELRSELTRLGASADDQALRMLAASAWLRAREAKEGAEDPAMLASCRQWLGSDSFLHAGAWRLAFEEARNEFDTR
jgi:hypothetical protein